MKSRILPAIGPAAAVFEQGVASLTSAVKAANKQ